MVVGLHFVQKKKKEEEVEDNWGNNSDVLVS